jgi:lipid II:glycine glycyltransferase (peptidoglycan interpeptide bridge formation enzyme)
MPMQTRTISDSQEWNERLSTLPYAHVLQSWHWGEFKQVTTGWTPARLAFERDGATVALAQVLTRREGPYAVSYVPKGPALEYADTELRGRILGHLLEFARQQGAIFLKIDPDVVSGIGLEETNPLGRAFVDDLSAAGWRFSREQIQFRNTVQIDLTQDEETLLANMKQKTRYNVRLAGRKGVTVREGTLDDLDLLYDLYAITAGRDRFTIRPLDYYRQAWGTFIEAGLAQPLIAEYDGKALAHVVLFKLGKRAWYFYGASSNEERNRMPTYLLQWEAMRWAKAQGCTIYDLWGAPDDFDDPDDPLAGVWRFKSGLGGQVVRHVGAWDYPLKPTAYWAYTRAMPVALNTMRGLAKLRGTSSSSQET